MNRYVMLFEAYRERILTRHENADKAKLQKFKHPKADEDEGNPFEVNFKGKTFYPDVMKVLKHAVGKELESRMNLKADMSNPKFYMLWKTLKDVDNTESKRLKHKFLRIASLVNNEFGIRERGNSTITDDEFQMLFDTWLMVYAKEDTIKTKKEKYFNPKPEGKKSQKRSFHNYDIFENAFDPSNGVNRKILQNEFQSEGADLMEKMKDPQTATNEIKYKLSLAILASAMHESEKREWLRNMMNQTEVARDKAETRKEDKPKTDRGKLDLSSVYGGDPLANEPAKTWKEVTDEKGNTKFQEIKPQDKVHKKPERDLSPDKLMNTVYDLTFSSKEGPEPEDGSPQKAKGVIVDYAGPILVDQLKREYKHRLAGEEPQMSDERYAFLWNSVEQLFPDQIRILKGEHGENFAMGDKYDVDLQSARARKKITNEFFDHIRWLIPKLESLSRDQIKSHFLSALFTSMLPTNKKLAWMRMVIETPTKEQLSQWITNVMLKAEGFGIPKKKDPDHDFDPMMYNQPAMTSDEEHELHRLINIMNKRGISHRKTLEDAMKERAKDAGRSHEKPIPKPKEGKAIPWLWDASKEAQRLMLQQQRSSTPVNKKESPRYQETSWLHED